MTHVYARQRKFFRQAYETGQHGWPSSGPTPEVAELLNRLGASRGKCALDLGCGEGRHTILLARRGFRVTGIDLEPLALAQARKHLREARVAAKLLPGNALDLRFGSGTFDVVLDYGCFHHLVVKDWPRYRLEISRVLRPSGVLLLSVFSMKFRHYAGERRGRNWLVHRNHYDHFFTREEIRRALSPAFVVEHLLEEHRGLNGFLHVLLRKRQDRDGMPSSNAQGRQPPG